MDLLKPASDGWHRRAFGGIAYPVGQSLPESATPIIHVEDDQESRLIIDDIAGPSERPALRSLVEIVGARLHSIPAQTRERSQQVEQLLVDAREYLEAADEMYSVLEAERVEALRQTWDKLQTEGRALRKRINNDCQIVVNDAMRDWREAEAKKGRAKAQLAVAFQSRRAIKLDRYSTVEQKKAAETKYQSAVQAMETATVEHIDAERALTQSENEQTLAQSKLSNLEIAMDRLTAQIQGEKFHDPQTGLSIDPLAHLEQ
jgi:chromosome segregation ATPase